MQATETAGGDIADVVGIQPPGEESRQEWKREQSPGKMGLTRILSVCWLTRVKQGLGLTIPWCLAPLPPGSALFPTEEWSRCSVGPLGCKSPWCPGSFPGLRAACLLHAWKWAPWGIKIQLRISQFSFLTPRERYSLPSLSPQIKYKALCSPDCFEHTEHTNPVVCSLSTGERLLQYLKGTE